MMNEWKERGKKGMRRQREKPGEQTKRWETGKKFHRNKNKTKGTAKKEIRNGE